MVNPKKEVDLQNRIESKQIDRCKYNGIFTAMASVFQIKISKKTGNRHRSLPVLLAGHAWFCFEQALPAR
jgi:hypothetical protein